MCQYLDIETWNRKEHFYFFKDFDKPFFNLCAEVDITGLKEFTQANPVSFFLTSLFIATKAANAVPEFHYRLRGDRVLIHKSIHAGSTVLRQDETFGFCYFDYIPDFNLFIDRGTDGLSDFMANNTRLEPALDRDDLIHFSVIPWVSFTGFSHARTTLKGDSVPKIVLGKYFSNGDKTKMPVSVEVHHALMDGLHVGRFFDAFDAALQELLSGK